MIMKKSGVVLTILVVVCALLVGFAYFKLAPISGKALLDIYIEQMNSPSNVMEGNLKLSLRQGELIPMDSLVVINQNGDKKEIPLRDLVSGNSEGNYFIENGKLSGSGEGYGFEGEKIIYPDVHFTFSLSEPVSGEENGSVATNETSSENSEENNSIVENQTVPSNENSENQTQEETVSEAVSEATPAAPEVTQEATQGTTQEETPEASSETESSTSDSSLTGNAVAGEIIEGVVSKDKPYEYVTNDDISIENVYSDYEKLSPSVLKISKINGKVIIATDYSYSEKGFGLEFLGNKQTLEIPLDKLNVTPENGTLRISLVYNGENLADITKKLGEGGVIENVNSSASQTSKNVTSLLIIQQIQDISLAYGRNYSLNLEDYFANAESYSFGADNFSGKIEGSNLVIIPENNFSGESKAEIVALQGNESIKQDFKISVSNESYSVQTKKYRIVINQPVKWHKKISVSGEQNVTIELPKEAENVSVLSGADAVAAESKAEQDVKNNLLTGEVSMQLSKKKGFFTKLWEKVFGVLTGKVVADISNDVQENGDSKVVDVQATNDTLVEYYTPAPTSEETNIPGGKRVVISAAEELNYTDILAYSELDNTIPIADKGKMKIYHYNNDSGSVVKEEVQFDAYDLDEDGNIDYVEWVVPHLSEQVYEVIYNAQSSLVGYWTGNDTAEDSSGNGNNGAWVGNANYATGISGSAFSFDGSSYIDLGTGQSLKEVQNSSFTVSLWFNATNTIGRDTTLFANTLTDGKGFGVLLNRFDCIGSFGDNIDLIIPGIIDQCVSYTFNTNEWYNLVAVQHFNSSGNLDYADFFVNGNKVGNFTASDYGAFIPNDATGKTAQMGYSFLTTSYFNGSIDEVMVFNRSLSAQEISNLYNDYMGSLNKISDCTTISSAGNYLLTGNIGSGGDCIIINAIEVSIDGHGFTVTGNINGNGKNDYENGYSFNLTNINVAGDVTSNGAAGPGDTAGSGGNIIFFNSNVSAVSARGGDTGCSYSYCYGGNGGTVTFGICPTPIPIVNVSGGGGGLGNGENGTITPSDCYALKQNGEACSLDTDCQSGRCGYGSTQSDIWTMSNICTDGGLGNPCFSNRGGCNGGLYCSGTRFTNGHYNICTDGSIGAFCNQASGCSTGYCSGVTGLCTNGETGIDSCYFLYPDEQCSSGICGSNSLCGSSTGESCSQASDCQSNFCDLNSFTCSAPVLSPGEISSCGVINQAGTYTLTAPVSSSGTCFSINSSDVDLEGNGYSVEFDSSSNGNAAGVNISGGLNNITLNGLDVSSSGTVSNTNAIYISGALNNSVISNNNLLSPYETIFYGGTWEVILNLSIIGNNIGDGGFGANGIWVTAGLVNSTIFGNNIASGGSGINVAGSFEGSWVNISSNNITSSGNFGALILYSGVYYVEGNQINSSSGYSGIYTDGVSNSTFKDNSIYAGDCIRVPGAGPESNNLFSENVLSCSGWDYSGGASATNFTFLNQHLNGYTFSSSFGSALDTPIIENSLYGKVDYYMGGSGSGISSATGSSLSNNIQIGSNSIIVDGNSDIGLISNTTLSFYGLGGCVDSFDCSFYNDNSSGCTSQSDLCDWQEGGGICSNKNPPTLCRSQLNRFQCEEVGGCSWIPPREAVAYKDGSVCADCSSVTESADGIYSFDVVSTNGEYSISYSLKSDGDSCSQDTDCQSSYCDQNSLTCSAVKPNGYPCSLDPECQLHYCDQNSLTCATPVLSPGEVVECGIINQAGTYTLSGDIDATSYSGNCLDVQSSDVLIDLNGKTITGGYEINGIYVNGYNDVNITSSAVDGDGNIIYGTITGFTYDNVYPAGNGIYLENSQNDFISNIAANSNVAGITLGSSTSNNILSNIAANSNGGGIAFYSSSSNNTLTNITTNSNSYIGIDIYSSSNNTLTNITANSNWWAGIYLGSNPLGNIFNGEALSNTNYDVYCYDSSINTNNGLNFGTQSGCDSWINSIILSPGEVVECGIINQEGYYYLGADIDDSSQTVNLNCVSIESDNVILDGNNHSLKGYTNDNGDYHVIYASGSRSNITIENFNDGSGNGISGQAWGIGGSLSDSKIVNNVINTPIEGMILTSVRNNITNNYVSSSNNGIYFSSSSDDYIADNNLSAEKGIYFESSSNDYITNNQISSLTDLYSSPRASTNLRIVNQPIQNYELDSAGNTPVIENTEFGKIDTNYDEQNLIFSEHSQNYDVFNGDTFTFDGFVVPSSITGTWAVWDGDAIADSGTFHVDSSNNFIDDNTQADIGGDFVPSNNEFLFPSGQRYTGTVNYNSSSIKTGITTFGSTYNFSQNFQIENNSIFINGNYNGLQASATLSFYGLGGCVGNLDCNFYNDDYSGCTLWPSVCDWQDGGICSNKVGATCRGPDNQFNCEDYASLGCSWIPPKAAVAYKDGSVCADCSSVTESANGIYSFDVSSTNGIYSLFFLKQNGESCSLDTDCQSNYCSLMGYCQDKQDIGRGCDYNPDCLSGLCWNSICSVELSPGEISSCGIINQPGTYTLTGGISSDGNCLNVQADDVVINCGGNTISGTSGIGVNGNGVGEKLPDYGADGRNFTIENCIISGFGVSVSSNAAYGAYLGGNGGSITINNSQVGAINSVGGSSGNFGGNGGTINIWNPSTYGTLNVAGDGLGVHGQVYIDGSVTCSGYGSYDGTSCSCDSGRYGDNCQYTLSVTINNPQYVDYGANSYPGFDATIDAPYCFYSTDDISYSEYTCGNDPFGTPAEGNNIFYVKGCADELQISCGNVASVQFTYDSIFPAVSISSPASENVYGPNSWSPYVAWDDSTSCEYDYNNLLGWNIVGCANAGSDISSPSFWSIPEGSVTLSVRGSDFNTNTVETNVSFTWDSTAPLVDYDLGTPSDGDIVIGSIFVNVSVVETNFANVSYNLYNESGLVASASSLDLNNLSYTFTGLAIGNYTFNATVYDLAGNSNSTLSRNVSVYPNCLDQCSECSAPDFVAGNCTQDCTISQDCGLNENVCNTWTCYFRNLTVGAKVYTGYDAEGNGNNLTIQLTGNNTFREGSEVIFSGRDGTQGGNAGIVNISVPNLFDTRNAMFVGVGGSSSGDGLNGGNGGQLVLNYRGLIRNFDDDFWEFPTPPSNYPVLTGGVNHLNEVSGTNGAIIYNKNITCVKNQVERDVDISGDGVVDSLDYLLITNKSVYNVNSASPYYNASWDISCDGKLNVLEISREGYNWGRGA